MTKRERQAREYAAERIEDAQRLGRYLRRHWLPIMRRLNYAAMVCSGGMVPTREAPDADVCPWCENTDSSRHECP